MFNNILKILLICTIFFTKFYFGKSSLNIVEVKMISQIDLKKYDRIACEYAFDVYRYNFNQIQKTWSHYDTASLRLMAHKKLIKIKNL